MSVPDRSARKNGPCIELLDEAIVEVLRRKTPTERVAMIFAANRTMRLRLESHLRTRHPDWDSQAVTREIARPFWIGCVGNSQALTPWYTRELVDDLLGRPFAHRFSCFGVSPAANWLL